MADELSGLQLREAVAKEVMGVVPREIRARDTKGYITVWCDHPIFAHNRLTAERLQGTIQSVPAYESDIAAAWLVVERMREQGAIVQVRTYMSNSAFPYGASIRGAFDPEDWWPGNSPAEAIARAALSAVRASTKEAK